MKQGKSLTQLASEVERQQNAKKDFSVPVSALAMDTTSNLVFGDNKTPLTGHAHAQLGDYLGIPRKYYQTMQNAGATNLLANNVNHWLGAKSNDKRLVRTLDGNCRALLSSRYRMLDNYDLMTAILPTLQEQKVSFASSEVTENKLYLKVLYPKIEGEITKGDVVQSGVLISNSEVGGGGLKIQPLVYRLVCTNGMILPDSGINKYHIGKSNSDENIRELLTDETKMQTDRAFWLSVRDVLKASCSEAFFAQQIEKMQLAAGLEINHKAAQKIVEVIAKKNTLTEEIGKMAFENLLKNRDMTMWGLANAFTEVANDTEDYELATSLESLGGNIINLNKTEWKVLNEVA